MPKKTALRGGKLKASRLKGGTLKASRLKGGSLKAKTEAFKVPKLTGGFLKTTERVQNRYFWEAFRIDSGTQIKGAKRLGISTRTYRRLQKAPSRMSDSTFNKVVRYLMAQPLASKRSLARLERNLPGFTRFEQEQMEKLARDASAKGISKKKIQAAIDKALKIQEVEHGSSVLARLNTICQALGLPRIEGYDKDDEEEVPEATYADGFQDEDEEEE